MALIAGMTLAFVLAVTVGWTRTFFALTFANTENDLVALGVGIAGAVVLTLFVLADHTRADPR
jgi:hypothetical protein